MSKATNKKSVNSDRFNSIEPMAVVDEGTFINRGEFLLESEVQSASDSLLDELEKWRLRMGLSQKSSDSRSRIGIYTDFF